MPACTLTEFKDWSGVSLPDARLTVILSDARRAVLRDGVSENHEEFNYLHRLRAVMSLPGSARANFSGIRAKSISGISVSYGGASGSENDDPLSEYYRVLESVIGISHRLQ